jgi:hypothetical protein
VSLVLATSLLVPYAALTLDPARSEIVGGILLPPVVLMATVALGVAAARARMPAAVVGRGLALFGIACILVACASQAWGLLRRSPEFSIDGDGPRASRFILTIADAALQHSVGPVKWSTDAHLDFGAVQVSSVYYYEQRGVWPNLVGGLGDGPVESTVAPEEVRTVAAASDVLILTRSLNPSAPAYPYDRSIEIAEPILRAVAVEQFDLVAQDRFYGRDVFGFIRRSRSQPR